MTTNLYATKLQIIQQNKECQCAYFMQKTEKEMLKYIAQKLKSGQHRTQADISGQRVMRM